MGICGKIGLLAMALVIAGCAIKPESMQRFMERTSGAGRVWQSGATDVDGWTLAIARKGLSAPARIYIEGDGRAYVNRNTPSGDPTPQNPVGLKLALNDPHDSVLYVARPCQWEKGIQCKAVRGLWTDKRFIPVVVERYVALIKRETQGQPVELVGFSGGAWIALQVAARLENVTKVITVAGNLSPDWINTYHKVSKIDVMPYPDGRLRELPVDAYMGTLDKVIGDGVVDAYRKETGAEHVKVIKHHAAHTTGWETLRIE